MSVTETKSNFSSLEKQLAKDSLEEALKNLHGEILREIERNKQSFSQEIQKTLETFKQNIKQHITQEVDNKIALHLEKNIQTINTQVTTSFKTLFSPIGERTENDMKRLHLQGEQTLQSWGDMMKQYTSLWTRPFFLLFISAIFTGVTISLLSSYMLVREQRETLQFYEKTLTSYKETLLWYWEKEKAREARQQKSPLKSNKSQNNKKQK